MTQMTVSGPSITVAAELTERCDRCGAAGKLRLVFARGEDLFFCGHHANRYADVVRRSVSQVVIESGFGWRGVYETEDTEG